jgi:BirA family biotin operon repressor/biotin-[acetyl-CoA-carboxylase] ligase
MDRAREYAEQGLPGGMVICAERQNAGRGRNGRTWASRQGGLFFSILERPQLDLSDYALPAMVYQIAVARTISAVCGKPASLRWPNDVYLNERKIAGVMTELSGEGDRIKWLAGGIGVNVNNPVPSARITSCAETSGRQVSRREILMGILNEIEALKKSAPPSLSGNPKLAEEWNSLALGIGGRAVLIDPCHGDYTLSGEVPDRKDRILAQGVYAGIDGKGRCMIKTGKATLCFSPGSASIILL